VAPKAVKDRVNQRRDKEAKNRWHVQRGANEIYYTDFGGLPLLIQGNLARLRGPVPDQHWIANRLNDLEASRNIILIATNWTSGRLTA
jgi:hypothetical protein